MSEGTLKSFTVCDMTLLCGLMMLQNR